MRVSELKRWCYTKRVVLQREKDCDLLKSKGRCWSLSLRKGEDRDLWPYIGLIFEDDLQDDRIAYWRRIEQHEEVNS